MIYNSRDLFYKYPFGAVSRGETVRFRLTLPLQNNMPVIQVYRSKTSVPAVSGLFSLVEDDMQDSDECIYECEIKAPVEGVYYYNFVLEKSQIVGRGHMGRGERGASHAFQLTITKPEYKTPDAFKGKVFYQIFPDRFRNSGQKKYDVPSDRKMHASWNEAPVDRPDEKGDFFCQDYFGGDLAGIQKKLPYIASLGVEAIYLNPIFEAHSNHRYNTADYMKVDPLLGTNQDFINLCIAAHSCGIKIILDGVFNHTGSDSKYFNKNKRYPLEGAYNSPTSPYRDWFIWIDYPEVYESWWGFDTLPNVNENDKSYRDYICGEDGVIEYWIRCGADGFRLDVADELPDDFIADIRTAVKRANPEALLIGEVWEDASNKEAYGKLREYFWGNGLDGVMNYPWRKAILDFVRYGCGEELEDRIMTILENYPPQAMDTALNMLSSHDIERAITYLGAEQQANHDREWQRLHNTLSAEQFYTGRQRFLLAAMIQYSLQGCPCLYYGDEAGLVGYSDPFNRGTFPWEMEDKDLVTFFQILGNVRKNSQALQIGDFTPVLFNHNVCVFVRSYMDDNVLLAVNRGGMPFNTAKYLPKEAEILLSVGGITQQTTLERNSALIATYKTKATLAEKEY